MTTLLFDHFDQLISTPEDVEKLNRSTLHLAMQGKLVTQDAKDEPASELMKRIKAGNTKQNQSLSKIEEHEYPFELPHNWEWVRLGELCRLENGDRSKANYPNKTVLVKEGVPFVNASHLVNGRIDSKSITFITKERFDRLRSGKFANGDILFCLRGSLGKSALVEGFEAGAIASSLVILKIHPYLSPYYFLNYLDSPLSDEMIRKYDNGTAQPNLSAASLAKFLIPLPPLAEQKRIVARVEELFAQTRLLSERLAQSRTELDRLNQSALAHLLASQTPEEFDERWAFISEHFDLFTTAPEHIAPLRQSILELAVRGKLTCREPGDEPAKELLKRVRKDKKESALPPIKDSEKSYELPVGWEWVRFGEIGEQRLGKMLDRSKNKGDYYPYLRNINVQWLRIDLFNVNQMRYEPDEINEYKLQPNDLLICEGGEPGRCAIWESNDLMMFQKAIHRVRPYNGILSKYLLYHLWGDAGNGVLAKYFTGATIKHFTGKALANYVCALPPLAEQERIVKRVEQLVGWCDALKARLIAADGARHHLLECALSQIDNSPVSLKNPKHSD